MLASDSQRLILKENATILDCLDVLTHPLFGISKVMLFIHYYGLLSEWPTMISEAISLDTKNYL